MTERESDEIVLYLHASRVDWGERVRPPLLRVWYDHLQRTPAAIGHAAAQSFFAARAPSAQGFPPDVGEFIKHVDRVWSAQVQAHHAEDRATERIGFRQIEERTTDDVGKASLALIFDLLDDKITLADYVQGLRGLHARGPALGFDRSADEVEAVRVDQRAKASVQ